MWVRMVLPSGPKTTVSPLFWQVAIGALLALSIYSLCLPGHLLHGFEARALDYRFRVRGPLPPSPDIVIVDIDDASIDDPELGRWEWDRLWHSRLVSAIAEDSPRAIVFDVIFSEPNRSAPRGDAALARATKEAGCVYYACYISDKPVPPYPLELLQRLAIHPRRIKHAELLPTFTALRLPLPELLRDAKGAGVIAMQPDADGILRRAFFAVVNEQDGNVYPTLPFAVGAATLQLPYEQMTFELRESIELGPAHRIPLDAYGRALVNFTGVARRVPWYSFADIVRGRIRQGTFTDKIVLVGFTAPGLHDFLPTSFPGGMFGVEINAEIIDNILRSGFLSPATPLTNLGLTLLLAVVVAVFTHHLRPVLGFVSLVALLIAYNTTALGMFTRHNYALAVVPQNAGAIGMYLIVSLSRFATEETARRRLRDEFGRYVPPQVVAHIDAGLVRSRFEGALRQISVLFADIRGFSQFAVETEPRQVVALLNEYFGVMTSLAFELEGTVDNIVADEICITFNTIEDQPNHLARAALLALDMKAALADLNRRWLAAGIVQEPVRIGVGVNSGEALVGNIGSNVRMQYTAIGPTMNLASRLQELNKDLGTTILAPAHVYHQVNKLVTARYVGVHELAGHPEPVMVYEIEERAPSMR